MKSVSEDCFSNYTAATESTDEAEEAFPSRTSSSFSVGEQGEHPREQRLQLQLPRAAVSPPSQTWMDASPGFEHDSTPSILPRRTADIDTRRTARRLISPGDERWAVQTDRLGTVTIGAFAEDLSSASTSIADSVQSIPTPSSCQSMGWIADPLPAVPTIPASWQAY
eukprot:CAMPEP_0172676828 /NCGR_PEP_ID=MMETSP1074-20121228/14252_1 /TAXON_ID=2916 /ORGANISM="Ceratium fusus, Strain PA161109" /LENGTH=166 /DNA_ID=CAMNT_0013494565 /DNA_START=8 /DNA_END=508 /DNA_ORIENTATION=+